MASTPCSTPSPIVGSDDEKKVSGTGNPELTAEMMMPAAAVGAAGEGVDTTVLGDRYPADDSPIWCEKEGPGYWKERDRYPADDDPMWYEKEGPRYWEKRVKRYPADYDPMWWEEEGPDYWAGFGNTETAGTGPLAGYESEIQVDGPPLVRGG